MSERYARQLVLPAIGPAGQARLAAARVLVVGAGGLGSTLLPALAGAGIGTITIVDHDRVALSNLHRQPLYRMSDLGKEKALAATAALLAHNPEIRVEPCVARLGPKNVRALVAAADIVVDAADLLAVTYLLSDQCLLAGKPLVSASVLEDRGYVGAFCGGAPSYRAVFPDMPTAIGSCAANGVFPPVVAMLGAMQAQFVLQLALGQTPSPLGRLVSLDAGSWRPAAISFLGAPEPATALPFLDPAELAAEDVLVDLRGPDEAPELFAAGARRSSVEAIRAGERVEEPGRRVVLACRSGIRAHRAARILEARGVERLGLLALDA